MKEIKINNEEGLLRIKLTDMDGKAILNKNGEEMYWVFDLEDIETVAKWSDVVVKEEELKKDLQRKIVVINKRQDVKGKYSNSKNEEDEAKAFVDYYKEEIKNLNRFLGEGGVEKFLNGRKPYFRMFIDISKAIEQILPLFEQTINNFKKDIEEKYSSEDESILNG